MFKTVLQIALLFYVSQSMAQNEWKWPADKLKAQTEVSLYSEVFKQAESSSATPESRCSGYNDAIPHLRWLIKNCPDLNFSIYSNGGKVYKGLSECTKDKNLIKAYQDSSLMMYDLRIKYFGDEANVLNRKGLDAYKWHFENVEELYLLFKRILELNKNEIYAGNMIGYMDILCKKNKLKQISDDEVLEEYDKMTLIIENNLNKADKKQTWETTRENLDKQLFSCITVDCDRVISTLGPKLDQNSSDIKLAKRIYSLMRTGKCTADPLFLKAAKTIFIAEPSSDMAALIAVFCMPTKDFSTAIEFYNKAIELSTDPSKQAEYYIKTAECYKYMGNKTNSRSMARKSLALNPQNKDAYTLIGSLYMSSSDECKNDNPVLSKACFWAAYDQFEKAGNYTEMNTVKKYFPSKEELFFSESTINAKLGDKYQLGCWIGETTTIRAKD